MKCLNKKEASNRLHQAPAPAPFSKNAVKVLRERYFLRDDAGALVEDVERMLARVARAVAAPARLFGEDSDFWEARFLERMQQREFLPNSPTLMNAGLPGGQLAVCFVLPVEDDLDSIHHSLSHRTHSPDRWRHRFLV